LLQALLLLVPGALEALKKRPNELLADWQIRCFFDVSSPFGSFLGHKDWNDTLPGIRIL
jgi:hypothetical protein